MTLKDIFKSIFCCFIDNNKLSDSELNELLNIYKDYKNIKNETYYYPDNFESHQILL